LRPGLSYDMETIVLVGMAKHPTDRYRNAEAMANDLRRFRQGLPILTPRPGGWRTWLRTGWDNRSLLALVSLLVFVAGGTVALAARVALRDRDPTTPQNEQPVIDTAWVDEAIGAGRKTLDWRPYTPLGKDVELATVGSVVGPVRLGVTAQIMSETIHIELLICDRDIGRGYTLRLQSSIENGATLALLREDKVVTSRDLPPLTVGTLLSLHLDRIDDTVTAICNDEEPLSFIDLAPIEGPDADAVHLARTTDSLAVTHVRLERQRTGLFVSALAPADSLRQEGRFARAIVAYESFLRDQPNSPFARDARFRIALCHEALHDDERALTAYLEVARLDRDHAHHAIAALFRAWGCSLRLGRYQEAEQYFAAIRRSHDLPSLLASVPEDTINAVIADYAERAVQLRTTDPQRAVSLYSTGADLAAYLGLPARVRTLRFASADLLLALDRPQDVLTHLTDLPIDDPERLMRVGHAQRLMGHDRAAIAAYRGIIAADPDGLQGHWARWWAGDLVLLMDDDSEARTTWWEPAQGEDLPCRLMRHLMLGNRPMSLPEVDSAVVEYANARLAWRRGLDQQYRERLTNTVSLATDGAWPVPLARRLLGNEGTGP
jgi:tetratricopeptide (TPR) repeat protein